MPGPFGRSLLLGPLRAVRRTWYRARSAWLLSTVRDDLRRLARIYLELPAPGHLDPFRAGTAPLRDDLALYEPLFAGSVRTLGSIVAPYVDERRFPLTRVWNRWFESVDVELYHCMLRTFRPKLVVEIGSGHSTRFATEALRRNGRGRIISIDPEPRVALPSEVEHIAAEVENVDGTIFESLDAGDVLFIDSSHTTEEASFHVERILPSLRPGVLCHHHDVPFPYAIYPDDDREVFGETDVLLGFYLRERRSFEVLTGTAYVRYAAPRLLPTLIRSYRPASDRIPTSLWTRKLSGEA